MKYLIFIETYFGLSPEGDGSLALAALVLLIVLATLFGLFRVMTLTP